MLKYFLVTSFSALLLVSCGPKKKEEAPSEGETKTAPMMKVEPKDHQLTPEEKDQLKIDEDNVMNAFPG